MDIASASDKLWSALQAADKYIAHGIPNQLSTAQSFCGDDMKPVIEAFAILRETRPFLPKALVVAAEAALNVAERELNLFLERLRDVVSLRGSERQDATRRANEQLQATIEAFRTQLDAVGRNIPPAAEKSAPTTINVLGAVHGQLNIAGVSIGAINQNITIAELLAAIDRADASSEEKAEIKSRVKALLEHPIVAAIVGGIAGSIVG